MTTSSRSGGTEEQKPRWISWLPDIKRWDYLLPVPHRPGFNWSPRYGRTYWGGKVWGVVRAKS